MEYHIIPGTSIDEDETEYSRTEEVLAVLKEEVPGIVMYSYSDGSFDYKLDHTDDRKRLASLIEELDIVCQAQ